MGIFSNIGKAKTFEKGSFVRPGKHRLKVEACKIVEARSGSTYHCTEYIVLESEGGVTFEGEVVQPHNVGEKVTVMFEVAPDPDQMGLGNLKGMLAAFAGTDPDSVEEADADASISKAQPCAGIEVECQAKAIKTKKGNDFTVLNFYHVPAGG